MKKLIFTLFLVSSGSMLALIGPAGFDCDNASGYLAGLQAASNMMPDQLAVAIGRQKDALKANNCPLPPPPPAPAPIPYKR